MKEGGVIATPTNINGIDGEFTNSNALPISAGVGYKFKERLEKFSKFFITKKRYQNYSFCTS